MSDTLSRDNIIAKVTQLEAGRDNLINAKAKIQGDIDAHLGAIQVCKQLLAGMDGTADKEAVADAVAEQVTEQEAPAANGTGDVAG